MFQIYADAMLVATRFEPAGEPHWDARSQTGRNSWIRLPFERLVERLFA